LSYGLRIKPQNHFLIDFVVIIHITKIIFLGSFLGQSEKFVRLLVQDIQQGIVTRFPLEGQEAGITMLIMVIQIRIKFGTGAVNTIVVFSPVQALGAVIQIQAHTAGISQE
jgi:hypothetical protein